MCVAHNVMYSPYFVDDGADTLDGLVRGEPEEVKSKSVHSSRRTLARAHALMEVWNRRVERAVGEGRLRATGA